MPAAARRRGDQRGVRGRQRDDERVRATSHRTTKSMARAPSAAAASAAASPRPGGRGAGRPTTPRRRRRSSAPGRGRPRPERRLGRQGGRAGGRMGEDPQQREEYPAAARPGSRSFRPMARRPSPSATRARRMRATASMAQTRTAARARAGASRTTVGRRSSLASDRPPSGAGTEAWRRGQQQVVGRVADQREAIGGGLRAGAEGRLAAADSETAGRSSAIAAPARRRSGAPPCA